MIKTSWAIEITLVRITADVDEYGATIGGNLVRDEPGRAAYVGGFLDEPAGLATFEACAAQASAGRDFQYLTRAAGRPS